MTVLEMLVDIICETKIIQYGAITFLRVEPNLENHIRWHTRWTFSKRKKKVSQKLILDPIQKVLSLH